MPDNNPDITILSVSFHSQPYLELNYALTRYLNPSIEISWIVVQNTPPPGEQLQIREGLTAVEGVPFDPGHPRAASDHHARALNKGIQQVATRYALILDPDFFIVRKEWCQDVLQYLKKKHLSALGVPWHPRWWRKYRKFPAPHCLFLDLGQIEPDSCDFSPGAEEILAPNLTTTNDGQNASSCWLRRKFQQRFQAWWSSALFRVARWDLRHIDDSEMRQRILKREMDIASNRAVFVNCKPDTGYLLYQKMQELGLPFEFIPAVFHPGQEQRTITEAPSMQRLVDLVVTPDMALIPKQRGYYVRRGFREAGYSDTRELDCEEFMWKGNPFGFHVRLQPRGTFTESVRYQQILSLVENLTGFPHKTIPTEI